MLFPRDLTNKILLCAVHSVVFKTRVRRDPQYYFRIILYGYIHKLHFKRKYSTIYIHKLYIYRLIVIIVV